ncbi:MAG TPA: aldose 1-epimerase family protein [Solirubrobacteraceae bacterium]|nr:aldose 1-epimerase family protein [Solirubrobacteraceae bacterium]
MSSPGSGSEAGPGSRKLRATSAPPSGRQYEISHGAHRATIVEVGGGVREYERDGEPVLQPYDLQVMCDEAHGAVLIPWPNRLADGRYRFDGDEHQVALTEPDKHNAIHGFLRWRNWRAATHDSSRVVMETRLHPLQGWPHTLDVSVEYVVGEEGLTAEIRARNIGEGPCPIAAGQHPYLSPGDGALIDDCELELRAATRIVTDPERQLPTGREPVEGTDYDFTTPRRLGDQQIDYAFTDLDRDGEGRAWARLIRPDGRRVELWVDQSFPIIEIFTADTLPPSRRRAGLGCEPMSCPPNGLATGEGIVRLEPGEAFTCRWGVRMVG